MRGFAERLIIHETRGHPADAKSISTFIVFEKMRPHLATLMGNAGFHALLLRSLSLASAQSGWLRALHVNANGFLEGPDETAPQLGQEEIADGRVVLLSQLLGLLVAFIGESLTIRLVHEVWPELPADGLRPGKEGENEKTK
jgi:hypothetical protein